MTRQAWFTWAFLGVGLATAAVAGCNNSTATPNPATAPTAPTPAPPAGPGVFTDVTATTGIAHTYRNGEEAGHLAILESLGGGVALIDYNRDGLLDVFVTGGGYYAGPDKKEIKGHPCKLYKNLGNFKFQDVTAEVGLDKIDFYTHGATVGDYDNDGWPDLFVTGYGRQMLFHNDGGKGFTDVTAKAGLADTGEWHWSTSAGFADLDGDGKLDLFVTHYVNWHLIKNHPPCPSADGTRRDVCSPKQFQPLAHYLYLNNGDGTFRDGSKAAGLKPGKGLGCVLADFNRDGKVDIYVANDTADNYLYLNQGGGKFEEVGTEMAVARDDQGVPNGSMGVDTADYDGSGRFSIFVTNYQQEAHALYRNRGPNPDGQRQPFSYNSQGAGITAIGLIYVAFGTSFVDYDLDGAEDILISNGHVVRYPPPPGTLRQRPVLLRNLYEPGQKPHLVRFEEVSAQGGPFFQKAYAGRGLAVGDLDNDGRPDVVSTPLNGPVVVLRNTLSNGHNWLGVEVVGKACRDAVGTELTLEVGGRKLVRQVKSGASYLSSGDRRIVFGLGTATKADKLTVRWPSGQTQTIPAEALTVNKYQVLLEGEAQPKPFPLPPPGK